MKKQANDKISSHEQEVLIGLMEFRGELKHYIFSAIPNWSDAEDVLQEVCLKIWKNKKQYQSGSDFRAWAFTVTRYTILDFRKRYATRRVTYLDTETVKILADEMVASTNNRRRGAYEDALKACMSQMTDRIARLLRLHYKDGYTLAELAVRDELARKNWTGC